MIVAVAGYAWQLWESLGRAYSHRIPLAKLKCLSEKRVRELAGRLRKSREASDRDYNPLCPPPTSS
jgi:hypothetical protein